MGQLISELFGKAKFDSVSITYSFDYANSTWDGTRWNGTSADNFFNPANKSALSSTEQTNFAAAIALWDVFSAFSISSTTGAGDINIYHADLSSGGAMTGAFQTPTQTMSDPVTTTDKTRAEIAVDDTTSIGDSGYGFFVALHELGHALGLAHPVDGEYDPDYNIYMTVMSYNAPENPEATVSVDHWAITPMAYDIAALEELYGSFSRNSGNNDVYNASTLVVNGTGMTAQTIVDTGGTGDTIDLSGISGSHVIDLREAIDENEQWRDARTIVAAHEYIFIAQGSVIENATGGSGADTITGNASDNVLTGNGGNDVFAGDAGNDTINGGAGNDTMNGGEGSDTADYSGGTAAINATMNGFGNGTATDGFGNTDTLQSIESIVGKASNDIFNLDLDGGGALGEGQRFFEGSTGTDTLSIEANATDFTFQQVGQVRTYTHETENFGIVASNIETVQFLTTGFAFSGVATLIHTFNGQNYFRAGNYNVPADTADFSQSGDFHSSDVNEYGDVVTADLASGTISFEWAASPGQIGYMSASIQDRLTLNVAGATSETVTEIVVRTITTATGDFRNWLGEEYQWEPGNGTGDIKISTSGLPAALSYNVGYLPLYAGDVVGGDLVIQFTGPTATIDFQLGYYKDSLLVMEGDSSSGVITRSIEFITPSNVSVSSESGVFGTEVADPIAIAGTAGNNVMTGTFKQEIFTGGLGNDTLLGGAGDDGYVYDAGDGEDTITDIIGEHDFIRMGAAISDEDVVLTQDSDDLVITFDGVSGDSIRIVNHYAAQQVEKIVFADLSEMALVGIGYNVIGGTTGNDTLNGTAGNDQINALAGNDNGNAGNGNDLIYGGDGQDVFNGEAGNDLIYGEADDDTLNGGDGNDTIYGGAGNDTISGGNDNDILEGGSGTDILSYAGSIAGVAVNLATTTTQNTGGAGTDTVLNFEHLTGSSYDDTLTGNSLANIIDGGNGNDVIDGGTGSDTLTGGNGTDTVSYASATAGVTANLTTTTAQNTGGAGIDTISGFENLTGTGWNDTLTGDAADNIINGGTGDDVIEGGAGNDTVDGQGAIDTVSYASAAAAVTVDLSITTGQNTGGAGTDTIANTENLTGSAFNDTLTGTTGNNIINGGVGNDAMNGGAGTDTVTYASAVSAVTVNLTTTVAQNTGGSGTDTLSGFENLTGSAFNDTLTGTTGNNIIDGGNGDDVIEGGAGNDTLIGGGGTDAVTYANAAAGVSASLQAGSASGGAGSDTISTFENLIGSAFNDTLTGNSFNNLIEGGAGNDTLIGGNGTDTVTYANAAAGVTVNLATTTAQNTVGAGTDTLATFENLIGSAFNDTLTGTTGANVIDGGAGNDTMNGNSGTDTLTYASASGGITISLAITTAQNTGGSGTDTISNFENLTGSAFNDTLTGSSAINTINGGDGDDTIDGGSGSNSDTLVGGNGIDTLSYASVTAGVTVNLATTTNQSTGGGGFDTVSGFENLKGSAFNDTLTGNSDANLLKGENGNDLLFGADGNDILYGSAGIDSLTGGAGADTFVFETASAFSNLDTISDFSAGSGDKIDVHDVIDLEFDPLTEAISDFVNFTNSGGNSIMSVDRDGTGTTYAFTDVATLTGLTNQDEVALYNSGNLLAA